MASDQQSDKIQSKRRTIFLFKEIDENVASEFVQNLLKLEIDNPNQDVLVAIDSPGGYVDQMWCMIDAMNLLNCKVNTLVIGRAHSAATSILVAGTPGRRFCTPHARIMIHQISSGIYGKADEIVSYTQEITRRQTEMCEHILRSTKIPKKLWDEKLSKDWYISPQEALKLGIVDRVINNFSEMGMSGW